MSMFSFFPELPPELRQVIWCHALPEEGGLTLRPRRTGCWQARRFTEADEYDYEPDASVQGLILEFRSEHLQDVHVATPLISVNSEAREVALSWARRGDLRVENTIGHPYLVRPCHNICHDTLYVAGHQWDQFANEPWDRLEQPDIGEEMLTYKGTEIHRLAIPESLLVACGVAEIAQNVSSMHYESVSTLFIILGPEPDFGPADARVQPQWELVPVKGGFIWKHDRRDFEHELGEGPGDGLENIRKALGGFKEHLIENRCLSLKIRPAVAVKRS